MLHTRFGSVAPMQERAHVTYFESTNMVKNIICALNFNNGYIKVERVCEAEPEIAPRRSLILSTNVLQLNRPIEFRMS